MATKKKDFRAQAAAELMYWRDRLGFPDVTPQLKLPGAGGKPEVDPVAQKQFDVLVETLLSRAANTNQLDRIMSVLQAKFKACPTPPEIHEVADMVDAETEVAAVKAWDGKPKKCPKSICDGSGFVVKRDADTGTSGADFCECHAAYRSPKGATHAATAERS